MSRKALFITPAGELIEVPVANAAQQQFMPHVPYFARSGNLTSAERGKLEKERRELQQALPRLGFSDRARAEARIQEIERQLMTEIDTDRVSRREGEQPSLRNPMKGGGRPDIGNATVVGRFEGKRCVVNGKTFVRSDSGLSYLQIA